MERLGSRFDVACRHLAVFEETWKPAHAEAMACRDFEEFLAEAAKVFQLIEAIAKLRRKYIFRGLEEHLPEEDAAEKALYSMWLQGVESKISDLEALETTFGAIEGADQVRECVERARAFLANWRPPALSTAVGLRVWHVSDEEADRLRGMLNAKK
jgi:hypothetical protein